MKNENMVSFKAVNVVVPLRSVFSSRKSVIVEIQSPRFAMTPSLFSLMTPGKDLAGKIDIQQVDIYNGEIEFHSEKLDARLMQFALHSRKKKSGIAFRLESPHFEANLALGKKRVFLEGSLQADFRDQKSHFKINRFVWQTRDLVFSMNGRAYKDGVLSLSAQVKGDPQNLLRPVLGEFVPRGLTYGTTQIVRSRGGSLWINGTFSSPDFLVALEPFSELKGKLAWDNQSSEIRLEAQFRGREYDSRLRLRSKDRITVLAAENLAANSLAGMLRLKKDLPLAGKVEKGDVVIGPDSIGGTVFLSNGNFLAPANSPFKLTGEAQVRKDRSTGDITFRLSRVLNNAGEFSMSGRSNPAAGILDFQLDARLHNMEHLTPLASFYLDLDLQPWHLRGGEGSLQLHYRKAGRRIQIRSQIEAKRFSADGESIQSLTGEVSKAEGAVRGSFTFQDEELRGRALLETGRGTTTILFPDVQGESRKILKVLDIESSLAGAIAGNFRYEKAGLPAREAVAGDFFGQRLYFEGYALENVRGSLQSNLQDIRLKALHFTFSGGTGQGELAVDFPNRTFDISGSVTDMKLADERTDLQGRGSLSFRGKGSFFQDPLRIQYSFSPLRIYADHEFEVRGEALFYTDFSDFSLQSSGLVAYAGMPSTFTVNLRRQAGKYSGGFDLNLKDLNLIIPWKNNSGQARIIGQFQPGAGGNPILQGVASFSGKTLALPNFSHAITDFQSVVTFSGNEFNLQSFLGYLGKGRLQGKGYVILQNYQVHDLLLNFFGTDMELYPMDRVQCKLNADLSLRRQNQQLFLQGNLNFLSINWEREIDEPISFYTPSQLSSAESSLLKMLQFDIRMSGSENIQMNNSLGRMSGSFNLHLTGSNDFPILSGTIEGKSGEVNFSDRQFNLLKAKLVFTNKFFIDPLVQLESETDIQNFRIRFDIRGTASHPKPEFTSSPPLPVQDILALVSLGEIFKRSGSTEVSSQLGSSAMISSKLTQQIKNRASKLLGIDMLRIDPLLSGQSAVNAPWLTVGAGRLISKRLIVVYSTNLSTSNQQILYFQYQLSPSISVIGMRNEEGKYSIDFRYRQRR